MRSIFIIACLIFVSSQSFASPLDDVMDTKEFRQLTQSSSGKISKKELPYWVNQDTRRGRLFLLKDPGKKIAEILGKAPPPIRLSKTRDSFKDNILFVSHSYNLDDGSAVEMRLWIPLQQHKEMVELRLIPVLDALEPPILDVEYQEAFVLHGLNLNLYHHKSGPCSLLFKLTGSARLEFKVENCTFAREMNTLAESLQIGLLNEELSN